MRRRGHHCCIPCAGLFWHAGDQWELSKVNCAQEVLGIGEMTGIAVWKPGGKETTAIGS